MQLDAPQTVADVVLSVLSPAASRQACAGGVIASQRREIREMKSLISDLEQDNAE